MDQAQGAIDAARAAGAERYAPTELAAATDALAQANDAVAARDYRLALNHALESREQAQNAARTAADTRATLRGDIERSMAEVKVLIAQARSILESRSGAQLPRRTRQNAEQTVARREGDLQEVDTTLQQEDYTEAKRLLAEAKAQIETVIATLSKGATLQSARPRG